MNFKVSSDFAELPMIMIITDSNLVDFEVIDFMKAIVNKIKITKGIRTVFN